MALHPTLAKINAEIAAGELGRARDRLQGLLVTYPADLEVRRLLGEVFWRLQYPEAAGRYWYLLPAEDQRMEQAKVAFERRFGRSPGLLLDELRYRGGLDAVRGTHAEAVLHDLARRARMSESRLETLVRRRHPQESKTRALGWTWTWRLFPVLVVLLAVLVVIGAATVVGWVL